MTSSAAALLALDTAGRRPGVAVRDASGSITARYLESLPQRSEAVADITATLLAEMGLGLADISAMAVVTGPGSYTGLRTGLAFVRGLAFLDDTPVTGVGTLELLAFRGAREGNAVLAVADAGGGRLYLAGFAHRGEVMEETSALVLVDETAIEALLERARAEVGEVVVAVEEGASIAAAHWLADFDCRQVDAECAHALAQLGANKLARGVVASAATVLPCYIGTSHPRPNLGRVAASFLPPATVVGDSN